jgi:hypothetical protein
MDEAIPERTLISEIIIQAISDATRTPTGGKTPKIIGLNSESIDAAHFLTTHRVNPYLTLLGIDHEDFKKNVIKYSSAEDTDENRRALRYYIKQAKQLFPEDYGESATEFDLRAALQRIALRNRRHE